MRDLPPDLLHRLRGHGQEHVLFGWESLAVDERQQLADQLSGIDLEGIQALFAKRDQGETIPSEDRIAPAELSSRDALTAADRRTGEEMLSRGEVAVLLVAGGQGTRLGFDKPKGMFPIGPLSEKSLFQIHAEKVFATRRRYGRPVPFLIMTSHATHADTVAYFEEQRFFGLPKSEVFFFQQGTMPAVDLATGKLLLERPGILAVSPNGHGGTIAALADSGLLAELKKRGITSIFYFQVDNPLVKIAEPAFLGRHRALKSEASSKAIDKTGPEEKMGVFALIDRRCAIIEYSDLPKNLKHATLPDGKLLHRAGNPAIHLFDVAFLDRITQGGARLPYHLARKKVPCIDAQGQPINPGKDDPNNALKFEMFIFDALPLADRWLVQEALRSEEFSPVKNKDDDKEDCSATAKRDLINLSATWFEKAGVAIPRDGSGNATTPLEVSPRFALDAEELAARIGKGRSLDAPTYLE